MRILIIFSICVFLVAHASERALGSVNRRVLHQILDNQSSELPSTESPNSGPSGFRSSPSDNSPQTPFFPTETPPPPPPPPPPPSSFNSLPANISSISIPKSSETKPRSRKLLVGGAGALAAATLFGAASAFCYYNNREQKHTIPDAKSLQFSTTLPPWPQDRRQDRRNVRATSSAAAEASSGAEFLYLGTVVNSRGPEVGVGAGVGVINNNNKLESPDLNPLPPLDRLSYPANEDDDEEEFYSPKGGGSPTETTAAIKINNGNRTNSVCSSRSSSTSCSPSQSISLTMSPPVKFSRQSSPDIFVFQTTSPPPPPPPPMLLQRSRTPPSPLFSPSPPPLVAPAMPFITKNPTKQASSSSNEGTPRRKLKALHWDKVHAKSDRETVWDQLKSSSFQLNEEMIESLFVMNSNHSLRRPPAVKHEAARVLDPKKAQNIAILLKALNVTLEEVREALREGDPEMLGTELLECLLKMSPTREEERRLEDYRDELGPAETFLKNIVAVPLAFRRVQAMLYVSNFQSEIDYLNKSFHVLQVACDELRNSRMFMKLLEAVLKTGNRMNNGTTRGGAEAFKLDTLLKLVDVKGSDGKTTLLHFVVEEIARTEGGRIDPTEETRRREIGLRVVSGISAGLSNVRKAAGMDSDVLGGELAKLPAGIRDIDDILRSDRTEPEFTERMTAFVESARGEITKIQGHERMSLSLVKELTEYFHGDAAVEEARPFRIFMVVRDFLAVLDRVCREVALVNDRTAVTSAVFVNPTRPSPPHN